MSSYQSLADRVNERRRELILEPGQLVWVARPPTETVVEERQSRRLLPPNTGPWRDLFRHKGATSTYLCRLLSTGREASSNSDQLIPVRGNNTTIPDDNCDTVNDNSDDDSSGFESYHPSDFEPENDNYLDDDFSLSEVG
jgi:hypothetical protein